MRTHSDIDWLSAVSAAMARCRTETDLVALALERLQRDCGYDLVAIGSIAPADESLIYYSLSKPVRSAQPFGIGSPVREFLYGPDLGLEGPGFYHQNGDTPHDFAPFPEGGQGALWISLRIGIELLGCIVLGKSEGPALEHVVDAPVLLPFSNILALALQAARLRSEHVMRIDELDSGIHRLIDELNWLRSNSILMTTCRSEAEVVDLSYRALRDGLGFDRVGIFLIRQEEGRERIWEVMGTAADGSVMGDRPDDYLDDPNLQHLAPDFVSLIAGNAYYYCPDRWAITRPEHRHLLHGAMHEQIAVALRHGKDLLGFISVDNALTSRSLPESRAEVLVTFAQQVSVALENARLSEAERQARTRAEALLRASQAMNSTLDLNEVMQLVVQQARQALQGKTCDLVLYNEDYTGIKGYFSDGYSGEAARLRDEELHVLAPWDIPWEREMLQRKGPVLVDPAVMAPLNPQLAAHLGITVWLLVPLLVEREDSQTILGALYISYVNRTPASVASNEIDLAMALAVQAATALEKARLYVAERERATRLEELDNLRREFVSAVTHELRTPLTGIIGFAEVLQHYWDRSSDARRKSSVEKILTSARRLDRLVLDLLLTARLDDPHFSIDLQAVDLRVALQQAVAEIEAKYKGQQMLQHGSQPSALVHADGGRVAQILVNLLDNAAKYSPEGAAIEIGIAVSPTEARVWVRDHGPGLTEKQISHLFARFGRLGHQARPGQVGTGLGLYISRHLAQVMNGRILVESVVGQGSTFTLALPLYDRS